MTKRTYNYKAFYPLLKWVLALVSVGFFIYQWTHLDHSQFEQIQTRTNARPILSFAVVLLMLVNWFFESAKFRVLLRTDEPPSKLKAFFTVLGGTTISNFTPARTGDYIGRSVLLKRIHPIKVILATVTGNILQLIMTYLIGGICFLVLLFQDRLEISLKEYSTKLYLAFGIVLLAFAVLRIVPKLYEKYKESLPGFLNKGLRMIRHYNTSMLTHASLLSFGRYLVFSLQFYLLLVIFSTAGLPMNHIFFIPVAYLLQSLVPVPAVADVGVRVMFTTMLFGALIPEQDILLAVTSLWFINLIFPAMLGALYLLYSIIRSE